MSSVFEPLMYTTLRIECLNDNGGLVGIGTGFLIQRMVGEGNCKIYLVSNRHVLCSVDSIAVSFSMINNNRVDTNKLVRLPITNIRKSVVAHPDPEVDVAILECTGLFIMFPNSLYFRPFPLDMLATFNEPELSVAENVYFIGYPDNRYDAKNNLPLIRTGIIASHPKYDYNGKGVFIIDAQVFPGSSGSPVYIDLTFEKMKMGLFEMGERKIKLLGIVSQTMIRNNQIKSVPTVTRVAVEEVLGLGIVYKSTIIKELIDGMPIDN